MRAAFLALVIFCGILFLYAFRLNFPAEMYYDEVYHVKTARQFLTLSGNTDNTHPPLGKVLIAAAIKIFGDTSWAWRLVPMLAGIGILFVFQRLAKRALQNESFAWAAAVIFALDGISITQARIAMLNTLMLFFMLLSVFFFVRIIESSGKRNRDFVGFGFALGLTAASRWVGVGVLAVLGLLFMGNLRRFKFDRGFICRIALYCFLLPLAVYFCTHLILPFIKGYEWSDLWTYQFTMLHYHAHLTASHTYGSSWWSWPLMTRPIWYFFERKNDLVYGILCIANPIVMWAFIPAMGYLIWNGIAKKSWISVFIVLGFLSQWLPWAFIGRVKFFHYIYPAMPFLALAIAMVLKDLWGSKRGRIVAVSYGVLVAAMFLYWYPLFTAYPISEAYFRNHLWFKSWV